MSALRDFIHAEIVAHDRDTAPWRGIRATSALDMRDRQVRRFALKHGIASTVIAGHLYLDRTQLEALAEANRRMVEQEETTSNGGAGEVDGLEHWARRAVGNPPRRVRPNGSGE